MRSTSYKEYTTLIKQRARKLRNNPTQAEQILWNHLRRCEVNGFKFLRQHPILFRTIQNNIHFFIADFYCYKLKLVIEVDGSVHDDRKDYDMMRTFTLQEMGYKIFRFKNEAINKRY